MKIYKHKGICNNCSAYKDVYRIMPDGDVNFILLCGKCLGYIETKINSKDYEDR